MSDVKPVSARKRKPAKPYITQGYVILNPYGDVWGPKLFGDPATAHQYVRDFWNSPKQVSEFRYKVVPGRQIVEALPPSDSDSREKVAG